MWTISKNCSYPGLLIVLVVSFPVYGVVPPSVPPPKKICAGIKYREFYVTDKPELLIIPQVGHLTNESVFNHTYDICRIGKQDYEAKLVAGPFSIEHHQTRFNDLVFNYNPRENSLYKLHLTGSSVEKIHLHDGSVTVAHKTHGLNGSHQFSSNHSNQWIVSMDLDWNTKTLYFLCFHKSELKVLNIGDGSTAPKTLFDFEAEYPRLKSYPSIVKVFPNANYLVIKSSNSLMRLNKDGSNSLILHKSTAATISLVTLDHNEKNIYWMEKNRKNYTVGIYYASVNGGKVRKFEITDNPDYNETTIVDKQLKVDEKYVYYVATLEKNHTYYHALLRANKFSGKHDKDFGIGYSSPKGKYQSVQVDFAKFIVLPSENVLQQDQEDDISIWQKFLNLFD